MRNLTEIDRRKLEVNRLINFQLKPVTNKKS